MNTFKKTTLALAISALTGGAMAQSAPAPAPEPEKSPISANVTITNDYKYRGISQTNGQPAVQGGFDYAHESGFYIGNWNSTISWIGNQNSGVSAPVEMDFYGGIKKELIGAGFATDFGVLQYYYPVKGNLGVNPNTTELYLAQNFTFGPISGFVKVNYSLTTIFGIPKSSGSYYPDLTINYDTGIWGITANGHIGYQYIAGQPVTSGAVTQTQKNINYTDWKLGLTKDFGGGLSLSASYIGTNANRTFYVSGTNTNTPNNWTGRGSAVVALTKTF